MKGSEKQIAWAEKIIAEALQKNENDYTFNDRTDVELQARPEYAWQKTHQRKIRKAVYDFVKNEINALSSAKDVIDNRQSLKAYVIEKDINNFLQSIGADESVIDSIVALFAKNDQININDFVRWAI